MRMIKSARTWASLALVAACFAAAPGAELVAGREPEPTTAPAAGKIDPKAKALFDRYVEATGGKDNHAKVKTRLAKAKMEIVGANVSGTMVTKQMAPNKILVQTELAGLGTIEQGYDGKVGWMKNPMQGNQLIEGKQLDQLKAQASADVGEEDYAKQYTSMTYAGEETVDGKPADKVDVEGAGGKATQYFAKDTGLLLQTKSTVASQMGDLEAVMKFEEYGESGGIKYPKSITMMAGPQNVKITIDEVQINPDSITEDTFKIPDDIKSLLPADKK